MRSMNIALIKFSDNVGKTTLAYHLFKPRLDNAFLIGVETINDAGNFYDIKVKSKDFASIQEELLVNENVILDIGSSNVEQTLIEMKKYQGSHEDLDYFVIPVTPEVKQQIDSVNTAKYLIDLGISLDKIKFVFNQVPLDSSADELFTPLLTAVKKLKLDHKKPVIYQNEFFDNFEIKSGNLSLTDLVNNKDSIKASLREASPDEKPMIVKKIGLSRLASTVQENFNSAFNSLFK